MENTINPTIKIESENDDRLNISIDFGSGNITDGDFKQFRASDWGHPECTPSPVNALNGIHLGLKKEFLKMLVEDMQNPLPRKKLYYYSDAAFNINVDRLINEDLDDETSEQYMNCGGSIYYMQLLVGEADAMCAAKSMSTPVFLSFGLAPKYTSDALSLVQIDLHHVLKQVGYWS